MDFVKTIQYATDGKFDLIEISRTGNGIVMTSFRRRAPGGEPRDVKVFSPVRFDDIERRVFHEMSAIAGWDLRFTDTGYRLYKRSDRSVVPEKQLARQFVVSHAAAPVTLPPADDIPPTERSPAPPPRPMQQCSTLVPPGPPQIGYP